MGPQKENLWHLFEPRSIELQTRSCNELTSDLYRAPFSVLLPYVGKPNWKKGCGDHYQSCSSSLVHSSKAFPRLRLFTLVKTTALKCTYKRPKDTKWHSEVSSLHDLVFNSMDCGLNRISKGRMLFLLYN